jgi:hypothetical protein
MKAEKFFFPLMVFAAVVTVYLLLKRQPSGTTVQTPSTSASGVPNYATESPTAYNVGVPQLPASPLVYLQDPMNPDPASSDVRSKPPSYLAFNFGPSHDLTKIPNPDLSRLQKSASNNAGCGGCGGCNSCDQNQNTFPDGNGRTPLSTSPRKLVDTAPKSFLDIAAENLGVAAPAITSPTPSSPHAHEAVYTGPVAHLVEHPSNFQIGLGNMHFGPMNEILNF